MVIDAPGYLLRLESGIAAGTALLPGAFTEPHRAYIERCMLPQGGFAGRRGGADIYYTAFGLRAAALLGVGSPGFWERAGSFVVQAGTRAAGTVECFSTLAAARPVLERAGEHSSSLLKASLTEAARPVLDDLSRGGPSAESPGREPTLYGTFLAMHCWGMIGQPMPDGDEAARFVLARRQADGGFSDSGARGSGTNATSAAVAVLSASGELDEETAAGAARFFGRMQDGTGGSLAHGKAPAADLLSTFTALVAAVEVRGLHMIGLGDCGRFARELACDDGGFRAARPDDETDVEYTYYGVATMGLLAGIAAAGAPRRCNCADEPGCCETGD